MTKEVTISIRGMQDYEGDQSDSIELLTAGTLTVERDGLRVSYEESEMTGMEGTTTIFHITPRIVTLKRTGAVRSEMVFQRGKRHVSLYKTPYGNMEMGIATRRIHSTMTEQGGELEICYAIDVQHALMGENTIHIHVKEAKNTEK